MPSPVEDPQLNVPQNKVSDSCKDKSKLESDVPAIWCLACVQGDGPNVPLLTHPGYHANNTAAEGQNSSNARRQALRMIIELGPVSTHATLEDKVVGERDALVDS